MKISKNVRTYCKISIFGSMKSQQLLNLEILDQITAIPIRGRIQLHIKPNLSKSKIEQNDNSDYVDCLKIVKQ